MPQIAASATWLRHERRRNAAETALRDIVAALLTSVSFGARGPCGGAADHACNGNQRSTSTTHHAREALRYSASIRIVLTIDKATFGFEKVAHHAAAGKRLFEVQLINAADQGQILCAARPRQLVDR
jgi:hypothetical protein